MTGSRRHTGNRYGRSAEARQAVLEAADDLLVELGLAGLTVEGIARRAGVAKQTIYRWWPSKTDILLESFAEDAAESLAVPDLGSLGDELRRLLGSLVAFLVDSDEGAVFRALAGLAQHDPGVASKLADGFLAAQRERDRQPFRRAIERGELPADTDIDDAVDRLVGPVYYRALVARSPIPTAFVDALIDDATVSRSLGRPT